MLFFLFPPCGLLQFAHVHVTAHHTSERRTIRRPKLKWAKTRKAESSEDRKIKKPNDQKAEMRERDSERERNGRWNIIPGDCTALQNIFVVLFAVNFHGE